MEAYLRKNNNLPKIPKLGLAGLAARHRFSV